MSRASGKTILSSKTPKDIYRGSGILSPQSNTPTGDSDEPGLTENCIDWGAPAASWRGDLTSDGIWTAGPAEGELRHIGTDGMGFQVPGLGTNACFEFKEGGTRLYLSYPNTSQAQGGLDKTTTYAASGKARILQVDLTSAYDLSTVDKSTVQFKEFDISGDMLPQAINNAAGIRFKDDGTKMFLMLQGRNPYDPSSKNGGERLYEFALSSAWDITSATLTASKDLSGYASSWSVEDTASWNFSTGGDKFFIFSTNKAGEAWEYTLGTNWDVTSTWTSQLHSNFITNVPANGGGGSSAWDPAVGLDGSKILDIWWDGKHGTSNDGEYLRIITDLGKIYRFDSGSGVTSYELGQPQLNAPTSNFLYTYSFMASSQYYMSQGGATFVNSGGNGYFFSFSDNGSTSYGRTLTRYTCGTGANVHQSISYPTPVTSIDISFDLQGNVYNRALTGQCVDDFHMTPEAQKKFYVFTENSFGGFIFKYDVLEALKKNPLMGGTINWEDTVSIEKLCKAQDANVDYVRSLNIKPDGTQFIVGAEDMSADNMWLYKFSLSSAWDIKPSSVSFSAKSSNVLTQWNPDQVRISPDGTLVTMNSVGYTVIGTTEMGTGWDVTTLVTATDSTSTSSSGDWWEIRNNNNASFDNGELRGFYFNKNGTVLCVCMDDHTAYDEKSGLYTYKLNTAYDIRTMSSGSSAGSTNRGQADLAYNQLWGVKTWAWKVYPWRCFLSHDRNYVYSVSSPEAIVDRNRTPAIQCLSQSQYYTGIVGSSTNYFDLSNTYRTPVSSDFKWASNGLYAYSHDKENIYRYKTDTAWDLSDLRRDQTLAKSTYGFQLDEPGSSRCMGIDISRDGTCLYFQTAFANPLPSGATIELGQIVLGTAYDLDGTINATDTYQYNPPTDYKPFSASYYGLNGLQVSDDQKDFFMLDTNPQSSGASPSATSVSAVQPNIKRFRFATASNISSAVTVTDDPLWSQTSPSNAGIGQGLVTAFHYTPGGKYLILHQDALGALVTYQCKTPFALPSESTYIGTATYSGKIGGYSGIQVDSSATKYFFTHSNTAQPQVYTRSSGSPYPDFTSGNVLGGAVSLFTANLGYNFSGAS
jgi:hypothetical protein